MKTNSTSNHTKHFLTVLYMAITVRWPSFMTIWYLIQKIYSKMLSTSCVNSHHDVRALEVNGIDQNIKNQISHEQIMTLPWNKKLDLCLTDHIFGSYHFFVEVISNKFKNARWNKKNSNCTS